MPLVSAETRALRGKLDATKLALDQIEAALLRRDRTDADLQRLRAQTEPLSDAIRGLVDDLQPRVDGAKARLGQLGQKPKEGEPAESAEVEREHGERETAVADLDETLRLARALLVQADQIAAEVGGRHRAAFARTLMQRTAGILSPQLWTDVARSLPRDAAALELLFQDWAAEIDRNGSPGALTLLGLAIGAAIALYIGRRHLAPRLVRRDPAATDPPRMRRLLAALGIVALGALPAMAGSFVVYEALQLTSLVPGRVAPVVQAFLGGLAFIALVQALAEAILAPRCGAWRLVALGDAPASRTAAFAVVLAAILAAGRVFETLNQAIFAALSLSIATKGVFALLSALTVAELLRRFAATASREEECLGPYVPSESEIRGPIRVLGWAVVAAVVTAAVTGYVALASFLVDQLVWISLVLAVLLIAIVLVDELIAGALRGQTRVSTLVQANTGLRRRSLEQIAVLANGLARVALILIALMLALAPWGVDSADLLSSVRAAFFGFRLGDVTIAPATVVFAILIFVLGFAVTRIIQRWLDTTFLPATDLDAGLRNSISTAFGYLGFFVAAALAFSYLGLSLDKIAIVAGALSVGIGFGLQSVVNNFVSGLILLWERPIRVGDLVVVGDGEGHVKKISVRATEIETFDRSTIIVPNSNLISGIVKNRVRGGRTGRVVLSVNVLRNQDPARAAELLTACADKHPEVLKTPRPSVVFKKIGDTWLEFELIAYVADVNVLETVRSELNFAIFRCLTDASIMPPLGPPALDVKGLTPVETALEHIAEAIASNARDPARDVPEEPSPQRRPKAKLGF